MIKFFRNCLNRPYSSRDILVLAFGFLCINIVINLYNASNGLGFPYDSFLYDPADRFGDFFNVVGSVSNVITPENVYPEFIYYEHILPFSATYYLAFAVLIKSTASREVIFFCLYLLLLLSAVLISRKQGNRTAILFLALCSYPMIFAIDRGNLAIVVFVALLFALCSESLIYSTMAVAIAASFKLTPSIFLIPILLAEPLSTQRLRKGVLLFAGWFFALNLTAILINGHFLTPHVYNPAVLLGEITGHYNNRYVDAMAGLGYGSSLYMPTVYIFYQQALHAFFVAHFRPLTLAVIVGAGIAILGLWKRTFMELTHFLMTKQKMTFIICICFVLFMPVTGDYYLLIMLLPLLVYPKMYYSVSYFLLYGALLGAKTFFYVDYINYTNISIQVFINPVILLILLMAEFDVIGPVTRSSDQASLKGWQWNQLISIIKHNWRRKLLVMIISLVIVMSVYFFVSNRNTARNKTFASTFNQKEWSYTTDAGKSWVRGAANALKNFDKKGRPVHQHFVWGIGKWKDENTIEWTSVVGTEAKWRGVTDYSKVILSETDIVNNKKYASEFNNKTWVYSADSGQSWDGPAEVALKGFDEKGRPVHSDPVWGIGKWNGPDSILWVANVGSSSVWKSIPLYKNFVPTHQDIVQWRIFSEAYKNKKWYFSVDNGATWIGRAENKLKEFDENGRPVHVDAIWGIGQWEDQSTIQWTAQNGNKSVWKAIETAPE
ncbi:MAG: hypothetical protein WDN75_05015 [Bacteroidota bacterium]